MKKFTKMHVLALALLASQQVMPSERQEDFLDLPVEQVIKAEPKKSYWTWDNGKWVLAGAAALGAGALAYMYQDDIKAWVSSLTEQEALEHKAALLEDVMHDLEDIEQKQESIKNKEDKAVKDIAATQEEIAAKQEQVAKKQTMLEYLQAMFTAAPLSEEDRLTAEEEAAWKKQNEDDRESDARQAKIEERKKTPFSLRIGNKKETDAIGKPGPLQKKVGQALQNLSSFNPTSHKHDRTNTESGDTEANTPTDQGWIQRGIGNGINYLTGFNSNKDNNEQSRGDQNPDADSK